MNGFSVEVFKDAGGKIRWRIVLVSTESYEHVGDARDAIERMLWKGVQVKINFEAPDDKAA